MSFRSNSLFRSLMQFYQLYLLHVRLLILCCKRKKFLQKYWSNRDEKKDWNIKVIFNSTIYSESSNWDDEIMKYLGDLCDNLAENQKRDIILSHN